MQLPRHQGYAKTREEALERSKAHRTVDPFPELPAALLSSEHIQAYVRQTGMLYPFFPRPDGPLKAASYEINPGGSFIYWDPKTRKKIINAVGENTPLVLPANSITFVELQSEFFLPDYIAVRFNLRIQHVHRGILLGTGPLVDPGFSGRLLVPLHNLTSDEYKINATDGLIWIEFTKTSRGKIIERGDGWEDQFIATDQAKTNRSVEVYFEKANRNNPIQSSLQQSVEEIKVRVKSAESAAKNSKNYLVTILGVGLISILGAAVSIVSFFETVKGTHFSVMGNVNEARHNAADAKADAKVATSEIKQLTENYKESSSSTAAQAKTLAAQLTEANERISRLENEIRRLSARPPRRAGR
jgi:deoxycytidine triphosphate deaminase/uncharacterized small protein (DUF1192 family)